MDAERLTLEDALKRYLNEVAVTKRAGTTAYFAQNRAKRLLDGLGGYSLAAITPLDQCRLPEQATGRRSLQQHRPPRTRPALMRAGELRSLRHDQVDLKRRVVTLTMTKNGSARTVPLTQAAVAVFELAINNPARPADCDLIFFGEPGRDKTRRRYEFRPAWQQVLKDHGITGLRFHDLRHEAVSRLVEAGLGDQEVAAISGHKSMQMLRRYTHLRAEDPVARLDQLGVT